MKCSLFVMILVVTAFTYTQAQDETAPASPVAKERSIIVPQDDTPFTNVAKTDIVRLTGKGIAGAKITAKVDGPAKIIYANLISERANGSPLIGPGNKEFEIKPTGKGKVTVTITSTGPQGDAKPVVTKYAFDVK
jgi:hypothetical protein